MDGLWHYDEGDGPRGPVPVAQLRTRLLAGALDAASPVRREGSDAWQPLGESALAPLLRPSDPRVAETEASAARAAGADRTATLDAAGGSPTSLGAPVRTFGEAIRACFGRYATFQGRAGRPELWWFYLFSLLLTFGLTVLDVALLGAGPNDFGVLSTLGNLVLFLPSLAVGARRLHDTDLSAWWLLLGLIPVLGFLALVVLWVRAGTAGANRFGAAAAGPVGAVERPLV